MRLRWLFRHWSVKSTVVSGVVLYLGFYILGIVVFSSPTQRTESSHQHKHREAKYFLPSSQRNKGESSASSDETKDFQESLNNYKDVRWKTFNFTQNLKQQKRFPFLDKNFTISDRQVLKWLNSKTAFCGGNVTGYGNLFVHLKDVLIDPSYGIGGSGGEEINQVLNQAETKEYLELKQSYFNIECNKSIKYKFESKDHLNKWISSLKSWNKPPYHDKKYTRLKSFTIAIQRYEYVNLYHTMTDFYNAFLMLMIFKQHPSNVSILWIDSHPKGGLDEVWRTLFGSANRAGHLKSLALFKDLVWGITGYFSPLNLHDLPSVPYLEEFRTFFLTRHGIPIIDKLNCKKITLLFIFRRDYVAHPRNPKGLVSRKIKNEYQLIKTIKKLLPGHSVIGIQTDHHNMTEQLHYVSNTDILVGMHGAGLSHTLFLPKHAGLIELYPTYWPMANKHFRAMAQWRKLHYSSWQNENPANELPNKYTFIPVNVVSAMVDEMFHKICGRHPP